MVGIGAEAEAEEDSDAIDCLEMIQGASTGIGYGSRILVIVIKNDWE